MQISNHSPNDEEVIKTACHLCHLQCGINVYIERGRIVKVDGMSEHPFNQGDICVKARHAIDYVYSEDRLKYPMKKENGKWLRTSWEEALDTIATKLRENKETYGPSSLMVQLGDAGSVPMLPNGLAWRVCDAYGTPSRVAPNSLCWEIRQKAHKITLGKFTVADPESAKCIILWGTNPHNSNPWGVKRILSAISKGAKLIVVDPRCTPFAKRADVHVQPRPGTDGALALAMLNTITSEGLYDREFVEKWTFGFDRLADHVKQYPVEEVEQITWVSAEDIKKIARIFASNKPACIVQGTNSLDQQASGFQNSRAIAILQAITGNIDVPGGYVRVLASLHLHPFGLPAREVPLMLGADKYPIAHKIWDRIYGESQAADWADTVLSEKPYPTKAMIIAGHNPVVTAPNSGKVQQALKKVDLLVVMDIFMTATAEMAHIVLPACTFLERTDLADVLPAYFGPEPYVMLRKPVIQPLWESWPDGKFWLELGKRLGYDEYFPWKDIEEVMDYFMEPSGLTVKHLKEEAPSGLATAPKYYDEYKKRGFHTPSGKVELYSEELERLGYDPLPTYYENPESAISSPELAKEYPLVLTTGARILEYWHSQYRNVPGLRHRVPDPAVEVHPETARKYGVADGEWAIVETKRGSIEIKASVTEDIAPNVVSIPHGWEEANVNKLTDNTPADPVSGYPVLKGLLCRMRKKT